MNTEQIDFKKFKYGAYARKSSESEDKQMQSIERQIDDLLEIRDRESLNFIGNTFEESQSAFEPGRPHFNELVRMTKAKEVNAWLCWHPNRLSRNPVDAGTIVYLMDLGLLHHVRTPSRIYYNTPTDKMMLQIEFTMSKKDSDDKSGAVRSGLKKRYKKGLPNGKATLGFLNDKSKEKGDRGWLVDQENFSKLKLIFARFLKGNDSITTIYEYAISELKLTTPQTKRQGGNLVHRSHIYNALINPIYAGFFYSKDEDGVGITRRDLDKTLPRIISEDEHSKILNYLGRKSFSIVQKHEYAYTGYILSEDGGFIGGDPKHQLICDCKKKFAYKNKEECPYCGVSISKMKNPKYLDYVYYYNVKRRKTKEVKAKTISETKVDSFLESYIEENLLLSPKIADWIRKHIDELKDKELEENKTITSAQENSTDTLDKEKKKLREMYRKEMISEEEYKSDLVELESKYSNKAEEKIQVEDWFKELHNIIDVGLEMKNIIKNGTVKDKKEFMSRFRSNIVWNEENLNVSNVSWIDRYINVRKRILSEYTPFEHRNNVVNKGKNTDLTVLCPTLLPR